MRAAHTTDAPDMVPTDDALLQERGPQAAARPASDERRAALLFCGGRSRRMGQDKALLPLAGSSFLALALASFPPVERVVLAVGRAERSADLLGEALRAGTSPDRLVAVVDRLPEAGPLAGLEAGLDAVRTALGEAWALALACDMPNANARRFLALLERAQAKRADAVLLRTGGRSEPLYAAYHTRLLPAVRAALDAGERRMDSFHGLRLDSERGPRPLRIVTLDAPAGAVRNVNTPDDLDAARAAQREASA